MPIERSQNPTNSQPTLAERVKARVAEAERMFERHGRDDGSKAHREQRSLRRVYTEMRATYRAYRRETRAPEVPELRTAARAFQRGKDLSSLVEVATFLDERKLLAW